MCDRVFPSIVLGDIYFQSTLSSTYRQRKLRTTTSRYDAGTVETVDFYERRRYRGAVVVVVVVVAHTRPHHPLLSRTNSSVAFLIRRSPIRSATRRWHFEISPRINRSVLSGILVSSIADIRFTESTAVLSGYPEAIELSCDNAGGGNNSYYKKIKKQLS